MRQELLNVTIML